MMRKILLVSGCSNTDKDFYSELHPELDTSWPKWPELLAKKLDMDCVNLGKSGAGNAGHRESDGACRRRDCR